MTIGRAFGMFALFALLAAPFDAEAQGRGNGKHKAGAGNGNGRGSVHCRSGQGHPVHGRQWCRDKGWESNRSVWSTTRDRRDDGRVIVIDRDRDRDRDDEVIVIDRDRDRDRDDRDRDRRAEPRIRWPF